MPNSQAVPSTYRHFPCSKQLILGTFPETRSCLDHPHVTGEETDTEQEDSPKVTQPRRCGMRLRARQRAQTSMLRTIVPCCHLGEAELAAVAWLSECITSVSNDFNYHSQANKLAGLRSCFSESHDRRAKSR